MVFAETILNDLDWKKPFTVHTDVSDKYLGVVIIQNTKTVPFPLKTTKQAKE